MQEILLTGQVTQVPPSPNEDVQPAKLSPLGMVCVLVFIAFVVFGIRSDMKKKKKFDFSGTAEER